MLSGDLIKIQALHRQGLRNVEIARATGLSEIDVSRGLKQLGLKRNWVQYAVYDKRDNECLIAIGSLPEVAKIMGVSVSTARTYTTRSNWRYEVVRIG